MYFGAAGLTLIACVATGILLRRLLPTVFQVLTVEQHSAAAPSVAAPTTPAFPLPANILAPSARRGYGGQSRIAVGDRQLTGRQMQSAQHQSQGERRLKMPANGQASLAPSSWR